jgi:hypothetical protein
MTGAGLFVMAFLLNSCVKSRSGDTDFSSLKPVVLIPEGGLNAFTSQALTFPGTDATDTAFFYVNYAATNVAPADETVTLAVDPNALQNFNSTSSLQYALFPDSIYSFTSTTVMVKKGNNYSSAVPLILFPDKIDATKSYMLPISIKGGPTGSTISGNFGTIWYHLIGNPIAGAYTNEWIRWNSLDTSGAPNYDVVTPGVIISPITPTEASAVSGTGITYIIDFQNNGGVLSNFSVSIDPASVSAAGITITGGPTIQIADPVHKIYRFTFTYNNSSGAARTIVDEYHK